MSEATIDNEHFVMDCLKQKMAFGKTFNYEEYLRGKGVADHQIPLILAAIIKLEQKQRAAKNRIQEGGVITTIGLGGIAYATANEKDGSAWLIWSIVGLGILANGLWKRKKIKQYP